MEKCQHCQNILPTRVLIGSCEFSNIHKTLQKSEIIFTKKSLFLHMSVRLCVCPCASVLSYPKKKLVKQKFSLKKVVRYISSVTKIHSESCSRHCSARKGKATPSPASHHTIEFYHVHWSWCSVRPLSLM